MKTTWPGDSSVICRQCWSKDNSLWALPCTLRYILNTIWPHKRETSWKANSTRSSSSLRGSSKEPSLAPSSGTAAYSGNSCCPLPPVASTFGTSGKSNPAEPTRQREGNVSGHKLSWYHFILFRSAGEATLGLGHARQMLYWWAVPPALPHFNQEKWVLQKVLSVVLLLTSVSRNCATWSLFKAREPGERKPQTHTCQPEQSWDSRRKDKEEKRHGSVKGQSPPWRGRHRNSTMLDSRYTRQLSCGNRIGSALVPKKYKTVISYKG